MKSTFLVVLLVLVFSVGCEDNSEEPPDVEVFSGELEVTDLQEDDPDFRTNVDTVVFTVKGTDYRLEHTTHNSNLCSSGGTVGDFSSNLITLTHVFTIPGGTCDSVRIPYGEFKANYPGDSLILGPTTIEFVVEVGQQQFTDSLCFTFRLSK